MLSVIEYKFKIGQLFISRPGGKPQILKIVELLTDVYSTSQYMVLDVKTQIISKATTYGLESFFEPFHPNYNKIWNDLNV